MGDEDGAGDGAEIDGLFPIQVAVEQVFHVGEPDGLGRVALEDRIAGIPVLAEDFAILRPGPVDAQGCDFFEGLHDVLRRYLVEIENVLHEQQAPEGHQALLL